MVKKDKQVSVIMPCYNDGKYIKESIASVLSQTYTNLELIIVNDGSTDKDTIDILQSICDPRIKIINSENVGPAEARNIGIKNSIGAYIMPVDSDDLIDSTYVSKCVDILEKDENIGVVYCLADLFGEKSGSWDLPTYSLENMLLDNVVFVTAMFRKDDWQKVGGFNTSLIYGMEDYDFWLSILELGREIVQIKEVLFHYRIKNISRTTKFNENTEIVKETYKQIYENHPKLFDKYKDEYAKILRSALIEQIHINRAMRNSITIVEKMANIPGIKQIIKKYILK